MIYFQITFQRGARGNGCYDCTNPPYEIRNVWKEIDVGNSSDLLETCIANGRFYFP
jgi:hypothetical protein